MDHQHKISLWKYKKLSDINDVVKTDDEDTTANSTTTSSCFRLKNCLKKLFVKSHTKCKKLSLQDAEESANNSTQAKIIRKLKSQQQTDEGRKTRRRQRCSGMFSTNPTHQSLDDDAERCEESVYVASGIYDKFGNSCSESLTAPKQQEAEAEDLSASSWYQSEIIGKFSEEILRHQMPGSFIIHRVSHKSKNFILSLRVPTVNSEKSSKVVQHHLIVQTKRGYRIKGAAKVFATITSLVTHHSVLAEQLPVTLTLQRSHDIIRKSSVDDDDDEYSIEELGKIFTNLEV